MKPVIYLDMDGVLADLFGHLAWTHGVDHWKEIKEVEAALVQTWNTSFFYNISPFENTQLIVDFVREQCDKHELRWGICSSPLRGDMYNSAYWKRRWLLEHDIHPNQENLIFTGNKHKYAVNRLTGKPNILVDDKPSNVKAWIDAGGIAIRFQNDQDDLEEYLFQQLEDAIELL